MPRATSAKAKRRLEDDLQADAGALVMSPPKRGELAGVQAGVGRTCRHLREADQRPWAYRCPSS